jgi:hypothetical protein
MIGQVVWDHAESLEFVSPIRSLLLPRSRMLLQPLLINIQLPLEWLIPLLIQ